MTGVPFEMTKLGRIYYEGTLPALVDAIKLNAEATERNAKAVEEANLLEKERLETEKRVAKALEEANEKLVEIAETMKWTR